MIRYALRCADGHETESWFASAAAFDRLRETGALSCALCGSPKVEKALMAPSVSASDAAPPSVPDAPLSKPANPMEKALNQLRREIEKNTDDVGRDFAREARKIHSGEAEARGIRGEATPAEAKALNDDGIAIAPIPWMRRRDS